MLQLQQYGMVLDVSHISSTQCHNFTIATRLSLVCSVHLLICLRLQLSCRSLPLLSMLSMPRYRQFQGRRSLYLLPLEIYQKPSMRLRHPLRHPYSLRNKLTRSAASQQASPSRAPLLLLRCLWRAGNRLKVSRRAVWRLLRMIDRSTRSSWMGFIFIQTP